MPTAEEISVTLGDVQEPHLRRSVNQLDMVRGIRVDGDRILVRVALVIPGESAEEALRRVITERVRARYGTVVDVRVAFEVMDDAERQAIMRGLREGVTQFGQGEAATQVLAVGSGKGGVGKSTTTTNLAASLARLGHSVGLLDADVWGFSIPRMLGVRAEPAVIGDAIVPPEAHGVKVVSIGLFTSEENPVVWRGPMLHKALQQFLTDVFWDEPDYLIVDLPPGTGDVSISIAQFLPGASMVIVLRISGMRGPPCRSPVPLPSESARPCLGLAMLCCASHRRCAFKCDSRFFRRASSRLASERNFLIQRRSISLCQGTEHVHEPL
jgi:ATP-binding protein involved in chromosome partitioning